MKILMFTNVYLPHVGGIQRSIATFKREFTRRGHGVRIVTPRVDREPVDDPDVVQVPAIQNVHGRDFSVALPLPGILTKVVDDFAPDVVHSHHPFFLGTTALRVASRRGLPLVFTYHTMWEYYTQYTPGDSAAMGTFVAHMAAEYCDLCDHVIAPCASVARILRSRGVSSPISVVPTGIDITRFRDGDGAAARRRLDIPASAIVAGYIGRLGPEKNLGFLARALVQLCHAKPNACALVVGEGEARADVMQAFREAGLKDRLRTPGVLEGRQLVDAYHALDVFAFASHSETQGLVLAEAMAAGRPIVALDAIGARDIVHDGENGRLLPQEDVLAFANALAEFASLDDRRRRAYSEAARAAVVDYSIPRCATRALDVYDSVIRQERPALRDFDETGWLQTLRRIEVEWELWSGRLAAAARALGGDESEKTHVD